MAKEIEIPVPWGHISGKWWGPSEGSPVIALHGWQDNAGTFDTLAPLLPPTVSLLCLDLPGHGYSSPLHPGQFYYHWWDGIIVLRRVVQYLKLDKVSLMGHSRGGSVVFLYAASFPDQVHKLICLDNAFPKLKTPEKVVQDTRAEIDRFLQYDSRTSAAERSFEREPMVEVAHAAYGSSVTRESCEVLMRRGMKPSKQKPGTYCFTRDPKIKLSGLGVFSKELVLAYAKQICCEYLNIRAVPGIDFVYAELYDEVLDIIKGNAKRFEHHKVAGTHHVHLNEPEKVADIIGAFLTS